jgi:hypothetical protein
MSVPRVSLHAAKAPEVHPQGTVVPTPASLTESGWRGSMPTDVGQELWHLLRAAYLDYKQMSNRQQGNLEYVAVNIVADLHAELRTEHNLPELAVTSKGRLHIRRPSLCFVSKPVGCISHVHIQYMLWRWIPCRYDETKFCITTSWRYLGSHYGRTVQFPGGFAFLVQ